MNTLTWGTLLVICGVAAGVSALYFFAEWRRMGNNGRGTPLYARGRSARRSTLYALAFAAIMIVLGRLTPLWDATLS